MFYSGHPDNYTSSFQIFLEGNLGIIYTLNGKDFLSQIENNIDRLYKECGIEIIMFSMLPPLLRRLRHILKNKCDFELLFSYLDDEGRTFSMVMMRLK